MAQAPTPTPSGSLVGLPVELRSNIFRWFWRSIVVEVERGVARRHGSQSEDEDEKAYISRSCDISLLPGTPPDVTALRQTCKQFNREIDDSWHSEVTYHFPTTVSFIDILGQWSEEKVCSIRYAYVVDYPLPIYAYGETGYFTTLDFSDALPMFPGLQLEQLTVENIWLSPNGKPLDSWCFAATNGLIKSLLLSSGWRRLEYRSGILPLTPSQLGQLDMAVEKYRTENAEPDFQYGLGRVRPHTHSQGNLLDFNIPNEPVETTIKLVKKWYAEHKEERKAGDMNQYPEGVAELHVAMWAARGSKADIVQSGQGLSPTLESFKNKITWSELRKTDEYLVGDGLHDPTAYL